MTPEQGKSPEQGDPPEQGEPPRHGDPLKHVVMLVGNDVTSDPRLLKYVATADRFGLRVTAVGISSIAARTEDTIGTARVIRVAVPERAQVSGPSGRWRLLGRSLGSAAGALRPWFWDKAEYRAALARWEQDSGELAERPGRERRDSARATIVAQPPARDDDASKARRARTLRLRRLVLAARARPLRWRERMQGSREHEGGVSRLREARLRHYRATPSLARWRQILPEAIDQDLAIGPVVDELRPDAIHVHDVFLLGVGARAAHRAALDGRHVPILYDAHEYLRGLAVVRPRRVAAYCDLEREFIGDADRVITVSDALADALQRDHGLRARPDVVLNAPVDDDASIEVIGVREVVGLAEGIPLLVYGGGVNRARGVQTVVEALVHLPSVHLAVVVKRKQAVTAALQATARRLGVADRLHFAPFVLPELVPRYLASADVGISPLLHVPNHDMAVTNKFCEYLAGGLPIVTSDTPSQAVLVDELDLGAVYVAGDALDCARAIQAVLGDLPRLRARIAGDAQLRHRFSWAAQAERLRDIYTEVLGELPPQAWAAEATHLRRLLSRD